MVRITTITCDKCERELECVSNVYLNIGGNGAAETSYTTQDLCRKCFGELLEVIKPFVSQVY